MSAPPLRTVVVAASVALAGACAPDAKPGVDSGDAASGTGTGGDDTGGAVTGPCVVGELRSDETLTALGAVDDIRGDIPLGGVSIGLCGDPAAGVSDADGGWSVEAPDAGYITVLAEIEGALPARWLFDPRVEAIPEMLYRADMIWAEFATEVMAEVDVVRDPGAVVVVVEAMDPDTRVDLADAVVTVSPAPEAYLTISIEGPPVRANVTNGLHDIAALNVAPGPITISVDAGPDRTCRVPDAIEVPAGGLLAVSAYCPLDAR